MTKPPKQPVSALVLIHTPQHEYLLLERYDKPGFWQSVTGSCEPGETPHQTAQRELAEETGIQCKNDDIIDLALIQVFEIFAHWRHRYAPGITHNTEHAFAVCVAPNTIITLNPTEHTAYQWLPWNQAIEHVFSWTNKEAILHHTKKNFDSQSA